MFSNVFYNNKFSNTVKISPVVFPWDRKYFWNFGQSYHVDELERQNK